jgi:hypothetical protein
MTSPPDDSSDRRAEAAALLAEMRSGLDAATGQLERMADELSGSRDRLDRLESVVDILLDLADSVVLVVDGDRHIVGMSRAAAERFEGPAIGKPLASVLPDDQAGDILVHTLPDDGAVLVVPDR